MQRWFFLIVIWLFQSSLAAEPLQLVTLQYPPYIYEQQGMVRGVAVDLVQQAFADMDVDINIRILPWARAISDIEYGKADAIFTAFKTPERERFADYSEEVLFLQNINIIQARDHPLDWQRHGARMSLCLVNNVSYGKHMDALINQSYFAALYRTNGASQCAQMLATGRADIWVNNEYGARVIIQRLRLEQKLLIHQPAVQSTASYIAFSKQRQRSAIRDRFDRALKKMKQDGRYQQLIDQAASEAGLLSHGTLLH